MDFKLPNLGENIESGDIVNVLVKEGDVIRANQPVIEVETGLQISPYRSFRMDVTAEFILVPKARDRIVIEDAVKRLQNICLTTVVLSEEHGERFRCEVRPVD